MGKYIIELDDKYVSPDNELIVSHKNLFDGDSYSYHVQIAKLTPYTEPDIEQVREEAYDNGYDDAKGGYKNGFENGMIVAWEAARWIADRPYAEGEKVFGVAGWHIIEKFTASEVIEEIQAYEQAQKEKKERIQVGDEVECIRVGWTAIVTKTREDGHLTLMGNDGAVANGYKVNDFVKTGRHFPEIAEVLAKMKESDNG